MQIGDLVMLTLDRDQQVGVVSKIYGDAKHLDVQWVSGGKGTCIAISRLCKVKPYFQTDKKCP